MVACVNGVLVEVAGGSDDLAHDIAVHIAFARPQYLRRDDVPADVVEAERQTLETITRNEGKPEAALPKIVEGRLNGFFKDVCLLEQPYAKDDKQSITQVLGGAEIVGFHQIDRRLSRPAAARRRSALPHVPAERPGRVASGERRSDRRPGVIRPVRPVRSGTLLPRERPPGRPVHPTLEAHRVQAVG